MNADRQLAVEYLRAPRDGDWRWAEDGAVVVWRDGTTVAFRAELRQIVEWLAPGGLPSCGALVLLLAATRGKYPALDCHDNEFRLTPPMSDQAVPAALVAARRQMRRQFEAAVAQLARGPELLAGLPPTPPPRCVLAEAVFAPARAERHTDAAAVLRGWGDDLEDEELRETETAPGGLRFVRQLHVVAEGLKPLSAESLAVRARTGLDALPEPAEPRPPAGQLARRLLEELACDPEFSGLVRAARELLAALRLPRPLVVREDLPIGGVADLTNRGDLDRLLLSELAHDDLRLATRVALNEALYMRREPPLGEPPRTLWLLLDSGVRLWGWPRVFATAAALALAARDRGPLTVRAWRAHGRELQPVDLTTRAGLTAHLAALEITAHPGDALPAFRRELAAAGADGPAILITHPDVLPDPDFQLALAAAAGAPEFVATVGRDGAFALHRVPLLRRAPVCAAQLDPQSWHAPPTAPAAAAVSANPELPAIYRQPTFPFLLPLTSPVAAWTRGADGHTYALLEDRRLVRYDAPERGALGLANDLPAGRPMWLDCWGHWAAGLVTGEETRLFTLDLLTGEVRVNVLLQGADVLAARRIGDVLLVVRTNEVRAYALGDGRFLGHAINPHQWRHGVYFQGRSQFYRAAWDGANVRFVPVPLPAGVAYAQVRQLFDREGVEGPWALMETQQVVSTLTGDAIPFYLPTKTVTISENGNHLLVPMAPGKILEHDLINRTSSPHAGELPLTPCWGQVPTPPVQSALGPLATVGWGVDQGLELTDTAGKVRGLSLKSPTLSALCLHAFELRPGGADSIDRCWTLPAEPVLRVAGIEFRGCRTSQGMRIAVDNLGCLHFRAARPGMPEVTLCPATEEVAGWTEDGHVCGPDFHFAAAHRNEPELVLARLEQILATA